MGNVRIDGVHRCPRLVTGGAHPFTLIVALYFFWCGILWDKGMGECLCFLFFCLFIPLSFSLLCYERDGYLLELLNILVILSMNLLFYGLLDRKMKVQKLISIG